MPQYNIHNSYYRLKMWLKIVHTTIHLKWEILAKKNWAFVAVTQNTKIRQRSILLGLLFNAFSKEASQNGIIINKTKFHDIVIITQTE